MKLRACRPAAATLPCENVGSHRSIHSRRHDRVVWRWRWRGKLFPTSAHASTPRRSVISRRNGRSAKESKFSKLSPSELIAQLPAHDMAYLVLELFALGGAGGGCEGLADPSRDPPLRLGV